MPQRVKCVLTVLLAAVLLAGCGGQETSGKQAEEEAQQEETTQEQASVEETTERDIHSEGCPEGQVSNAAGTECRDEEAPSSRTTHRGVPYRLRPNVPSRWA